jgi:hypothetical protein
MFFRAVRFCCWLIAFGCVAQHRYALSAVYFAPVVFFALWRRVRFVLHDA